MEVLSWQVENLLSRQNSSFGFKTRVLTCTENCSKPLKIAKLKFPMETRVLELTESTQVFTSRQNSSFSLETRVLVILRVSNVLWFSKVFSKLRENSSFGLKTQVLVSKLEFWLDRELSRFYTVFENWRVNWHRIYSVFI